MAARETRNLGILGDLQNLSVTMEANKEQLPQMEPFRLKLNGIVTQTLETGKQQAALRASKQEMSKQLRRLLVDGQRLADVVRTAVRDHFGPREEKIAEFGLQPFRGRKVKAAAATPTTPPAPASSESPAK
jgi:hypothetical protein